MVKWVLRKLNANRPRFVNKIRSTENLSDAIKKIDTIDASRVKGQKHTVRHNAVNKRARGLY